jgi:hypothetical protein
LIERVERGREGQGGVERGRMGHGGVEWGRGLVRRAFFSLRLIDRVTQRKVLLPAGDEEK